MGGTHQEEPELGRKIQFHTFALRLCSNGLDSKLATEDVENILSLTLVLWMTEALHGLSHLLLYIRAHFREVGLDGRVLDQKMRIRKAM